MVYTHSPKEPIAIIGTGCRFPGDSTSPSKLWDLLYSPRDLTREVPAESRFNPKGFYNVDGEHHGASNASNAYFIEEDPRYFDAGFFSIAPREAESIDPQQRLLLETVYEAMENAGLTLNGMRGSATSAYMGAMSADYTDTQLRDIENVSKYMITGTSRALLSNRLSYFFDWKGPSISVDTACSSSLAAVHLGVQALRAGECKISCVGGSNIILNADCYLAATSLHLLSPTGRSQMWDQAADGYARGEGVCVFLMKTLSQALRDGDRIDALLRETCVNSDGRTQGIALPSAEAQVSLMRTAYKNAGLDLSKAEDRPQYIEAHGTGTQAGDPREAYAIATTFFPPEEDHSHRPKLVVGSVKTVIGHTEGCAGIAGILKAVLAMRHKTIPPNQHFHNLNPSVKPSFKHLSIATSPEAWPVVPPDTPLRASVNGFGSGGTNCHAIVESYVPEIHDNGPWGKPKELRGLPNSIVTPGTDFSPIPLLFSASSGTALRAMLERYEEYLERTEVSLLHLAMTLNCHRSTLPVRISIPGTSRAGILEAIRTQLAKVSSSPGAEIGTRSSVPEFDRVRRPKILGVFTGQGAQWAGMGQALMEKSALFRRVIEMMEEAMAQLPDGPEWSLKEEIMKPPKTSRLGEAEISLPVCAALQVGLVKILWSAGITFSMVVGHSGGEIGSAYAAGKISEVDAIKIAYYRGVYTKLAIGKDGKRGGMVAVGFGYEDGLNFCAMEQFANRLTVAASNSPKSVTLSGDLDAVHEAKELLDAEGVFNRVLRLDTAYHSPHMYPCAAPYLAAIERCGLVAGKSNGTAWASSVYEDNRMITPAQDKDMEAAYWKDNLIGRVLFSQAVERALDEGNGDFDLALEVGPHPSLKGPTLETIRHKLGSEIPYSGVLDRKSDDITALSTALGFSWLTLGSGVVDFAGYASALDPSNASILEAPALPELPTYPWDHKKVLYRESRLNKNVRNRVDPPHPLLGSRTPDDTDYEPRWRNFFIMDELPWLQDHCVQGQSIVPAATYCVMALEAAKVLCRGKNVHSIELFNVAILRPIVLDEGSDGTETLFSVRSDIDSNKNENEIHAQFSLSAGAMDDRHPRTAATGQIRITLGSESPILFPDRRLETELDLLPTSVDRFYASMDEIGLSYSGPFRAMTSMRRRLSFASATVAINRDLSGTIPVHPTWLDACFQTFLAAFAAPRDGSLWTAFMPTTIGRMVFSPSSTSQVPGASVTVDAHITDFTPGYEVALPTLTGDMSIFSSEANQLQVKIEEFVMSSFLPASESDDRRFYLKNVWAQEMLSGALCASSEHSIAAPESESKAIDTCEKAVHYYLSMLKAAGHLDHWADKSPGLRSLIGEMEARMTSIPTQSDMVSMLEDVGEHIDLVLVRTIGEGLLNSPSEGFGPITPSSMGALISRWHDEGLGFSQLQSHFVSAAKQISHQHANLRILQVGPSSPGLVRSICHELGRGLERYSVVDDSEHNIEEMKAALAEDQLRVDFTQTSVENGIEEVTHLTNAGLFDLVIVHKSFAKQIAALKTIRSLLRPGGFMLMMAATGAQLRFPFMLLSALPYLEDDGLAEARFINPTREETHMLLRQIGFSGVDSIALDNVPDKHTFSVVVSQALDDHIAFLRSPLTSPSPAPLSGNLLVLGGFSPDIAKLDTFIQSKLSDFWQGDIINVRTLAELSDEVSSVEAVLSLTDLDRPVLDDIRPPTFKGLQRLFSTAKTVLWITHRARADNPYHNATIGIGRSFQSENPQKLLQFLDLDTLDAIESVIAQSFLRLIGGVNMRNGNAADTTHLWTIEPEVSFEKGKYCVPRLFPDTKRNDRLNALRRKVETQAAVETHPIALTRHMQSDGQVAYTADAVHRHRDLAEDTTDPVTIQVELCSIDPILSTIDNGDLFCCLGCTLEGARILGLSPSNASVVKVPRAWTIQVEKDRLQEDGALLIELLNEMKSLVIARSIPPGCTTLIYEPGAHLAASLRRPGRPVISSVTFKASSTGSITGSDIFIEPHASTKEIQAKLPPKTRMLIHMGRGTETRKFSALRQALPSHATVVAFNDLGGHEIKPQEFLTEALSVVQGDSPSEKVPFDPSSVVKTSALVAEGIKEHANAAVVDWTGAQSITLIQRPVDTRNLFSPKKTYLLVGLTGQIGQSMCRWMVQCGARHIVVTSRNPEKQGQLWKEELLRQGVNIVIEAADVTKKHHLMELRSRIVSSMPPVGGIANGAMLLDDRLFIDMPFESFQTAMNPKVHGSIYLEEVFSGDDLDFFLFFSSISVMTGQRTQANYVAANNFMVAMAERRRARGLPASVIDIGMVVGIGVIQRSQNDKGVRTMENSIRQMDYMPVSETDLHHLLAEAILVGQSDESPELITGLETYKPVTGEAPFWHNNLRFSHLMTDPDAAQAGADSLASAQKSLKEMLLSSGGPEEARKVMENALLEYLASSLKLSRETIYTDVPIIDLGIDSLVAVQIRNWTWAEAGYDLPVLKILGGSSAAQICDEVVSSLSFDKSSIAAAKIESQAAPARKARPWDKPPTDTKPMEDVEAAPRSDIVTNGHNGLPNGTPKQSLNLAVRPKPLQRVHARGSAAKKNPRPTPISIQPLSLGQSRLYFLSQYMDDDTVLNCTISYTLSGKLDVSKFEQSIKKVVQRHEALRTSFYTDEKQGMPMQGVLDKSPFQLKVVPSVSDSSDVETEFDWIRYRHYDLEQADSFAATILSHSPESHTLVFGYHHIIMDGFSWQIFQKDMAKFYNNSGSVDSAKYLPAQYSKFTTKQQQDLSDGAYAERLRFFQDQFRETVEPLPLFPFAKVGTRKAVKQYAVQEVVTHLDANVVSAIKKASQISRTTSFHFYLSVFQVLLHRLLDTDKMCIGVVDANRSDQKFVDSIGFFLETIPLLFKVDSQQRFVELLKETRSKAYAALAQTGVPTEEILKACGVASSTTETPLFQVCFNYRMGAGRTAPLQGVEMKFLDYVDAQNPFDLVATVDELDDGTAMITLYLQDYLYDQQGAQLLASIYTDMLEELAKNTDHLVGSVSISNAALEDEAIKLGTGPILDLAAPSAGTLSKMFNTWVDKDPHALAVKDTTGKTKTYLQLSERSNAIAASLLNAGATHPTPIGVLLEPGVDTIATILAILSIGAAYVPLDTRSSDALLAGILQESQPGIVVHHAAAAQRSKKLLGSSSKTKVVTLNAVPQETIREIQDVSAPEGLAMILYTSGSTGRPKGIPLTNANIRTPILGVSERVPLGREVVLQQSGQGFDAAVYQIFIALANGGTLIMADNRDDPASLATLMAHECVTCTTHIVSEMQALLKYGYDQLRNCSSWRIAMVAGEEFTVQLLDQFRALSRPDLKVINAYGPTEASICSSLGEVSLETTDSTETSIPIGKAIANYGTYIVDQDCKAVPLGWHGEVAIAGPGVASGYLNRPELTQAKFKTSESLGHGFGSSPIYLTGDKGRMLLDGSIVLSGRVDGDDQVKVRGHRVQLGEVARALVQASRGVFADAAVLLKGGDSPKQQLIAFVVFSRTSNIQDKQTYLRQLNQELPVAAYMRPAIIIPLDTLPVTDRGKLDTKKLASLPLPNISVEDGVDEQLTPTEARLRDVWKNVLGDIASSIPILRSSDFFSVGGNSLLLLTLKAEISQTFGVEHPVSELFQASTLELLAARLDGTSLLPQINWDEETALDETTFTPPPATNGVNGHGASNGHSNGISVLLTGATGFLGGHILRQLIELPSVAHVHCVAIRPSKDAVPRQLSVESPKIIRYSGDLALPNMGMSESEFSDLFRSIDVIVHNGAEVSHMKNYRSLRAANFLSTIELARAAVSHGIPIHYISTGGVARLSGADEQPEASLAAFRPPKDGSDGYVASKWASEVFLEKIQRRFQGHVWIHRPSSITGDDIPDNDISHSLLKFSRELGALPDLTGTGFFDFISVGAVSMNIAACVVKSNEKSGGDLVYIHQSGERVIPVRDLQKYVEELEGKPLQVLPLKEWVDLSIRKGLDEVLGSYMLASQGVIRVPLLQRGHPIL
ncbi:PKS-NRPS hybrid synthetase psoA [Aspergillus clavatus NRRL 1]|uniref:Hybrid NRPS/PKS enzyme, putative n=1 Tax=Aspergillus clavatus (strain ATCC 1007 / CBS 513.65 / DSM 816 / NCTC 3887 / NRRL 1 / QM 1276 / 107) TaxID=344612 RepID=A1C5U4_ASPCL|nr:hybrid NRPS/PKS enzyme, putative [Aspergillus clavatus NRRL 1]EAW15062.1 hybrid NRPS/PKS enzyme, putative [Aspergillus clavatus NRRL 1]